MLVVVVCFLAVVLGQYEAVENLPGADFLDNVEVAEVTGPLGECEEGRSCDGGGSRSTSPGRSTRCAVGTKATIDALNKLATVQDNAAFLVDSPVSRATLYASLSAFSNFIVTSENACSAAALAVAAAARV
jgi:hypothetical protein